MTRDGMGRLAGKVAIVTRGATGLGEAIAHEFVREGARVAVDGLRDDPVDDVVQALSARHGAERAVVPRGAVGDERTAGACCALDVQASGRLDVPVSIAGVRLFTDAAPALEHTHEGLRDRSYDSAL